MNKVFKFFQKLYYQYIKYHCPDCDGVLDNEFFDEKRGCSVYKCRECGKEWM